MGRLIVSYVKKRRPPRTTRTDTLIPCTPLVRAAPDQPADTEPIGARRGGWFVRVAIVVVVVLWLIPTMGVLVTSFRPEALSNRTGWWTALGHPFRGRSEEQPSELQSLMLISYAVVFFKKNKLPLIHLVSNR